MKKTDIDKLDIEKFIYKIKKEVEEKKGKTDKFIKVNDFNIITQNSKIFNIKDKYNYSDFTKYHDIEFINNIYKIILNRIPDKNGLSKYLELLRSGERNKDEIITSLRYSKEGKNIGIKLIGSQKKYILYILSRLPIVGYSLKWLKVFFTLPKLIQRLNSYESYISREAIISNNNDKLLEQTINQLNRELHYQINLNKITKKYLLDKIKQLSIQLEIIDNISKEKLNKLNENIDKKVSQDKIDNLRNSIKEKASKDDINNLTNSINQKVSKNEMNNLTNSIKEKASKDDINILTNTIKEKASKDKINNLETIINSKATAKEFELYLQSVGYAKDYMKLSQENIQSLVNEAKKRLPKEDIFTKDEILKINNEESHKLDSFYIAFEDRFRGNREEIKKRVEVYLQYIEKLSTIKDNIEILDVGCGRGEWLELLKDNGYNKAKGLDLNRIMVQHSQELGLNVIESDVIDYLKKQDNDSLSVITGFHIIEHLPFATLLELLQESYRVLKKGGLIIFETPNPENIFVGACDFYTDATHLNPIPPQASEFLVQYSGFHSTEIKRVNYNSSIEPLENKHLNHYIRTSRDYSIIAYKV